MKFGINVAFEKIFHVICIFLFFMLNGWKLPSKLQSYYHYIFRQLTFHYFLKKFILILYSCFFNCCDRNIIWCYQTSQLRSCCQKCVKWQYGLEWSWLVKSTTNDTRRKETKVLSKPNQIFRYKYLFRYKYNYQRYSFPCKSMKLVFDYWI